MKYILCIYFNETCVKTVVQHGINNIYIKLDVLNTILSKLKPTLVKVNGITSNNMYKFSELDRQILEYLHIQIQDNIIIPEKFGKIYKVDKLNLITHLDTNFFY